MADLRITGGKGAAFGGRLRVPGDKSITHRGLLLGALAEGTTILRGYLDGGDCRATMGALQALGIVVAPLGDTALSIAGAGARGLRRPDAAIECRNSGTTIRLLAGILAGQPFDSVLDGSSQLRRRPMARVTRPLAEMGARIETTDGRAPLRISASRLTGTRHRLAVPSAQVKSALLLAGLHAAGDTLVEEPVASRDHTERLLRAMGGPIEGGPVENDGSAPGPGAGHVAAAWRVRRIDRPLQALDLAVPGDPSSAAFPWALGAASHGQVWVEDVCVNPTRTGFLRALERMGARVQLQAEHVSGGEPVADVEVGSGGGGAGVAGRAAVLRGAEFGGEEIVAMIDELPVLAVVATQAAGETVVRDAAELRVKETDRIDAMVAELRRLGARIEALPDGFVVHGPTGLQGTRVDGRGDHRLVMALAVAGALADGATVVAGADCFSDSYPGFDAALAGLGVGTEWV
jgi:3-phosphoshikimate 1-carboxyvinyltransferase